MKRTILNLLIVFLTIFISLLGSQSVNAFDVQVSVKPTGNIYTGSWRCNFSSSDTSMQNQGVTSSGTKCTIPTYINTQHVYLNGFRQSVNATKGRYYVFYLMMTAQGYLSATIYHPETSNSDFSIVSIDDVTGHSYVYGSVGSSEYSSSIYQIVVQSNVTGTKDLTMGSFTNGSFAFAVIPKGYNVYLTDIYEYDVSSDGSVIEGLQDVESAIDQVNGSVNDVNDTLKNQYEQQQQQQQQEEQHAQDTIDSSQDDANSAQSDVDGATSNLIGIALDFIGILKDQPATNCKVNANLGNVDLGQVDYCTGVPQEFRNVISIVIALVSAPIGYMWAKKLIKEMIALFDTFFGISHASEGDE